MQNERWEPVVGEIGYAISTGGLLWSDRTGRLLRGTVTADGYLTHDFGGRRPRRRQRFRHWMVLEAFVGPRPPGMYGCHNDGDPSNNRLDNLRWDTPQSNSFDKVAHGHHFNSEKTHCPRGHPLIAPNLVPSQAEKNKRTCLACMRAAGVDGMRKKRGQLRIDRKAHADMEFYKIMGYPSPSLSGEISA